MDVYGILYFQGIMEREFSGEYQLFRWGVAADCGSLPTVRVEGLREKRLFSRPLSYAKEELSETQTEPLLRSFCKYSHVYVKFAFARIFDQKRNQVKWSSLFLNIFVLSAPE